MDLIVHGDHDGNQRMLFPFKPQPSMLHITGPDLKIAADPVAALRRQIQFPVFSRMEHGIFKILQNLPLPGLLGQEFIHRLMAFSEDFPHDGFMSRQVLEGLCDLRVFPPQVPDDNIQICHMIIGQPLNLLLLYDGNVLFLDLQL